MLINGIDIEKFSASFEWEVMESVIQYLEVYGCCIELLVGLKFLKQQRLDRTMKEAERDRRRRAVKPRGKLTATPVLPALVTPTDFCPRCEAVMMGEQLPSCERADTGRAFYAECSACPYYYEMFLDKDTEDYKKIEGD